MIESKEINKSVVLELRTHLINADDNLLMLEYSCRALGLVLKVLDEVVEIAGVGSTQNDLDPVIMILTLIAGEFALYHEEARVSVRRLRELLES